MPTYQWLINELIPAVSRTLLHSLWQGMLAAMIAGLIILCTRKTMAAIRYNALLFLFGSLITAVAITFFIEIQSASVNEATATITIDAATISLGELNSSLQADNRNLIATALSFVDRYSLLLASTWFLFFIFQLTRMAFGLREISYIRNKRNHAPSAEWTNWIWQKAKELGIQQSVVLLQSELAKIPLAIGYFKPVVLVPIGLLTHLSPAQTETVLLHELAHIKRKDYLVNLVQSFVDAIFFFNPAFVWLSSLIRQEREKCCDDLVIHHTNNQHTYLEALISFQEINLSSTYAMAIGSKKYYLLNRVKRILTRENSRLSIKEAASLVFGLMVIALVFLAFKPISPIQTPPALPVENVVIDQMQPTVSTAPAAIRDTVPQKAKEKGEQPIRFKKIISNIVDDGENNTYQVQATAENGTEYKVRRKGDEVTGFSINDKEIAKSEYHKYAIIMDAIERARKNQLHLALHGHNEMPAQFELKLDTLNGQLFDLNLETKSLFSDSTLFQEHLFTPQVDIETLFQPHIDFSLSQNSSIDAIISDLLANKLIQSETNVSFTLNNTELIVNGKTQSKAMHDKFKTKYLKHPADRYKYSKQGNSTSTEIYTN